MPPPSSSKSSARLLPQSLDAEQATLGAALISRSAVEYIAGYLKPRDFYFSSHRTVFEVILHLAGRDEPVDVLTVPEELRRRDQLADVGGIPYINQLAESVPTAAHAQFYAKQVREKSLLRGVIGYASDIAEEAFNGPEDVEEWLAGLQRRSLRFSLASRTRIMHPISEVVIETLDELGKSNEDGGSTYITGIATGWPRLDRVTGGLQRGDLIVVAGRPSMGKTALAVGAAYGCAHAGANVGVFSLEMSRQQVSMRMVCSEAKLESQEARRGISQPDLGVTDDAAWTRLGRAIGLVGDLPLWINDDSTLNIAEICTLARQLSVEEKGLDLLIVDYLQLIRAGHRMENRNQEIGMICRELKALARELNVALIVLSAVSREVEKRQDKRPTMADLRESGSIEAEADLIILLYREQYYRKSSERQEDDSDQGLLEEAELILAKHRNGKTCTVKMGFTSKLARFDDLDTLRAASLIPGSPSDYRPGYAQ